MKKTFELPISKKKLAKKLSEQELEGFSFGIDEEEK